MPARFSWPKCPEYTTQAYQLCCDATFLDLDQDGHLLTMNNDCTTKQQRVANMNPIAILLIAIPALTLALVTIQLIRAMFGNARNGLQVRKDLSEQIEALPYGNVLALEGIDQQALLHRLPLVELRQDLERCRSCTQTRECDQVLNVEPRDALAANELEFCPNMGSILQHKLSI